MPGNFTGIFSKYCLKNEQECITKFKNISVLEVNFLLHLQSFARDIFSSSKLVRPLANSFPLLGDMDDSNSQTFVSGYFSHSQNWFSKSLAFSEFASINFEPGISIIKMWLERLLYSKNCFFFLTSHYLLQAPNNLTFFSISLEGSSYLGSTVQSKGKKKKKLPFSPLLYSSHMQLFSISDAACCCGKWL